MLTLHDRQPLVVWLVVHGGEGSVVTQQHVVAQVPEIRSHIQAAEDQSSPVYHDDRIGLFGVDGAIGARQAGPLPERLVHHR